MNHIENEGTEFHTEGTARAKVLRQDRAQHVGGTVRKPCDWSRVSEGQRGRSKGREGVRAGRVGPCGPQGGLRLLP